MVVIETGIVNKEVDEKLQNQSLYYLREGKNFFETIEFKEQKKTVSLLLQRGLQSKNLNVLIGQVALYLQ